jgi:hypothetical protein
MQEKMTYRELVDLFGGEIPIEIAGLIWQAPESMSIADFREWLTAVALVCARFKGDEPYR